jgi:hypothetical protein
VDGEGFGIGKNIAKHIDALQRVFALAVQYWSRLGFDFSGRPVECAISRSWWPWPWPVAQTATTSDWERPIIRGNRLAQSLPDLARQNRRKRMRDKKHTYGTWVNHFGRAVFESLWRAMSSTLMKRRAILIFAVRTLARLASRWACHIAGAADRAIPSP